jgi:hypothetical protein
MKSTKLKLRVVPVLLTFMFLIQGLAAQDPNRFKDDVEQLSAINYQFDNDKPVLLFTGSSSIRKWKNIDSCFPDYNIIRNGFGGSHFSDLIFFYDDLIAGFSKYDPDVLFIYEGDNDIANGKKPSHIVKEAKQLLTMIRTDFQETPVVFISAKPSISRWNFKKEYITLNKKLKKFCSKKDNVYFVDVWSVMMDENGRLRDDLFLDDKLHMNNTGYELWTNEITKILSVLN